MWKYIAYHFSLECQGCVFGRPVFRKHVFHHKILLSVGSYIFVVVFLVIIINPVTSLKILHIRIKIYNSIYVHCIWWICRNVDGITFKSYALLSDGILHQILLWTWSTEHTYLLCIVHRCILIQQNKLRYC